MAVGLSTRLLCALQPVSVLVRDHLDVEVSKSGGFANQKLPSFEVSNGDSIQLQNLHGPGIAPAELRTEAGRSPEATPLHSRRQGYPS
jgi:hypothetical protein